MAHHPSDIPNLPVPAGFDEQCGQPQLSRRGLLRHAGLLSAGALAASLYQSQQASATPAPRLSPASGDVPVGELPSLDELAGSWMPVGTLLNMPSVNNFHGALHAGTNLLSFLELTFPPLSQGGESCRLALNGVNVQAHESRWHPYQMQRRANVGSLTLQSTVRMGFEQQLVLIELQVCNTGSKPASADIAVALGGYLRSYPGTWTWGVPRQYSDFSAWNGQLADSRKTLVTADNITGTAAAFAFPSPPDKLTAEGGSGSAEWQLRLGPGERRILRVVMAAETGTDEAIAAAADAREHFAATFAQARTGWEQRFIDAFTPGNSHFSGSLPVLVTDDRQLRDLYYRSILSVLESERTNFPQYFPRTYITAGPQWGVTLSYFWDTSLFAPILVLLDPDMAREQAKQWLELGIYNGYAVDALSGELVGPWYSANDLSVFTMLHTYVTLTGDMGFLNEQAGTMSVIDHLQSIALHWQQLVVPATGLADYGDRANLLEEVATYVNQVPSLNAANVWMMRQVADLRQTRGESSTAGQLRQQADQLAKKVLELYVPGQGVWETVHDDGTRVAVRHVYDFDTIGKLLSDDLTPQMRAEMAHFVTTELLAGGWMRALSLSDSEAAVALRPDHGSNGAYDSWPALAAGAMGRLGGYEQMLHMLRDFDSVGAEGPFSQSHEVVPEPSGLVVWDRDDLNPTGALTVTTWINPTSWPQNGTGASIVAKDAAAGAWYPTTPPNVGYALRGDRNGVISFAVAVGGKMVEAASEQTIAPGGWHHVAGTFDGHQLAVYIDGILAATTAATGSVSPATGTNLIIGADPINPASKFTGALDEVRIYRRALSATEITELYSASNPARKADDTSLVLRLPMEEGTGTSTVDTASGLAATIIAASWGPGRYGTALSFKESTKLTSRISRQQYNQPNGGSFASTIVQDLFGYAPDGQKIVVRDPGTPRGLAASLHGIAWQGRMYTLASMPSGMRLTPEA